MSQLTRTALALAGCALPLLAAAQSVPFVTTDELKRALDEKQDLVLADALSPIEFAEEHIAGAVNVTAAALRSGKARLPADKSRRLVFYCKGPK